MTSGLRCLVASLSRASSPIGFPASVFRFFVASGPHGLAVFMIDGFMASVLRCLTAPEPLRLWASAHRGIAAPLSHIVSVSVSRDLAASFPLCLWASGPRCLTASVYQRLTVSRPLCIITPTPRGLGSSGAHSLAVPWSRCPLRPSASEPRVRVSSMSHRLDASCPLSLDASMVDPALPQCIMSSCYRCLR